MSSSSRPAVGLGIAMAPYFVMTPEAARPACNGSQVWLAPNKVVEMWDVISAVDTNMNCVACVQDTMARKLLLVEIDRRTEQS